MPYEQQLACEHRAVQKASHFQVQPTTVYHQQCQPLRRPVLHLGGDLDGQARFSKLSVPALDSAVAAYKFGPRCGPVHITATMVTQAATPLE